MTVRIDSPRVPRSMPTAAPQAPVAPPPAPASAPPGRAAPTDSFEAPGGAPSRTRGAGAPPAQVRQTLDGLRPGTLSPETRTALESRLGRLRGEPLNRELNFLRQNVLNTPNADRAARTYVDLKNLQDTRPDRITQRTVETLTRGVAQPRSRGATGQEGVLGPSQARDAAHALIHMSRRDYQAVQGAMDNAGRRNNRAVAGADPQAERALILKAVGARRDELSSPGVMDRARGALGRPSSAMNEVTDYARGIAGTRRDTLIRQSTVIDLNGGSGALQQRWQDSCTPTSQQIARAEADPVYARRMHNEPIHSTNANTAIGREQRALLEAGGGTAVQRGQGGGSGMWPEDSLNRMVGRYNNHNYTRADLADSPEARQGALNRADRLLRDGIDVPIVVNWDGGGAHSLLLTDARGQGANREYLLTDPWEGRTSWIRGSDIAAGSTNYLAGQGRLAITYE